MKKNDDIPQYIIEALAKMILPEIQKFYATDEGKAFFENVKKQKSQKSKDKR